MQRIFSIWENKSKNGTIYYTGKLGDLNVVGFTNKKENEKQPDITFYVKEQEKKKDETTIKTEEIQIDPFEDFGEQIEIQDDVLD